MTGPSGVGRRLFEAKQETGTHQHGLQRRPNTRLEVAVLTRLSIDLHEALERRRVDTARERRLIGQRTNDLRGTRRVLGHTRRAADEQLPAAPVSATPVTICGPAMLKFNICGSVVTPDGKADLAVRERVLDWCDEVVDRRLEALNERRRDAFLSRLDLARAA